MVVQCVMLGCGVPQVLDWIKLREGTLGDVKGMGGAPGMFHVGGCVWWCSVCC